MPDASLPAELPSTGAPPVRDRLTTTLFLAATLHAILILGVTFAPERAPAGSDVRSLEVLIVQDPVAEERLNTEADYLAQVNQRGAGNQADARGAESPRSAPPPTEAEGSPESAGRGESRTRPAHGDFDVIATRADATERRFFARGAPAQPTGAPLVLVPLSLEASGADEGAELRLKGKAERELLVTANTRESSVAVYLDAWRRRIERIGTLNYPMEVARRDGMSGNPILEVQLLADGTLGQAIIRRSSGHRELDQAALGILKLAAPFDPFPGKLAAKHDALRLAYEWQFLEGELADSSVRMPANTR